jgi:hypothetical protein
LEPAPNRALLKGRCSPNPGGRPENAPNSQLTAPAAPHFFSLLLNSRDKVRAREKTREEEGEMLLPWKRESGLCFENTVKKFFQI